MGHRHMFNPPQIIETDDDQGWNHGERPYMPIVFRGASESGSISNLGDVMPMLGGNVPSQWTTAPRSNGYSSSLRNIPRYQPSPPVPLRDPFLHQSTAATLHLPQENYLHHPSSSDIVGGQSISGTYSGFYDHAVSSSRGSYKRKIPSLPPMCGRGSTSNHYDGVNSSDMQLPAERCREKRRSHHTHWEYPPSHGVNSFSIGSDGTHRNVRSRAAVDLDTNWPRSHLPSYSLHHSLSTQASGPSNSVNIRGQSSTVPREWSHALVPPPSRGMAISADPSFSHHVPSSVNLLNSHPINTTVSGGYLNEISTNRNHASQNVNSHMNQSVRGHRSGYDQRYDPTLRVSSSDNRAGHLSASEEQPIIAENHPSRRPHAFSNWRLRNIDRNCGISVPNDRYRAFNDDASFHDRLMPQSLIVPDQSAAYYGPGTLLDQHRDMRLDIDSMTYEELLALGEQMGTVSTGLQGVSISKCLTESIYCSFDAFQDEGTCVICLEEYRDMDDIGTLKYCGHDFHAGCIKKWLSIKNLCPICKATAIDEK